MRCTALWTTVTDADSSKLTVPVSALNHWNKGLSIMPQYTRDCTAAVSEMACNIVAQQNSAQRNTAQQHHATVCRWERMAHLPKMADGHSGSRPAKPSLKLTWHR